MKDIYNPDYYRTGKIEVADFIEDKGFNFFLGNVVKYVSRAGKKDGNSALQDLKKAQWYLDREIERIGTASSNLKACKACDEILSDLGLKEKSCSENKCKKYIPKNKCKNGTPTNLSGVRIVDMSDDEYADVCATISIMYGGEEDDDFPYTVDDFDWGDAVDWEDCFGGIHHTIIGSPTPKKTKKTERIMKSKKEGNKNKD